MRWPGMGTEGHGNGVMGPKVLKAPGQEPEFSGPRCCRLHRGVRPTLGGRCPAVSQCHTHAHALTHMHIQVLLYLCLLPFPLLISRTYLKPENEEDKHCSREAVPGHPLLGRRARPGRCGSAGGCWPESRRAAGWVPGQGTRLGCGTCPALLGWATVRRGPQSARPPSPTAPAAARSLRLDPVHPEPRLQFRPPAGRFTPARTPQAQRPSPTKHFPRSSHYSNATSEMTSH